MELEKEIATFHKNLRYKKSSEINLLTLKAHQCTIIKKFDAKRVAIKVENFHFEVLEVFLYIPNGTAFIKKNVAWQKAVDRNELYGLKEGIEQALRVLYYLNIPLGECIVQRIEGKKFSVYDVRTKESSALTHQQKMRISAFINRYEHPKQLTYGADLEALVYHQKRSKWIAASALLKKDQSIGWDAAAVMQNTKKIYPILELRPQPGLTGQQLFANLLYLYEPFSNFLNKNGMKLVGGANPYKHFFLGSHLHIGNAPLTFKHVALLDAYIGLPMAAIDYHDPTARRAAFGQLGAVRQNAFNGFEYRTLSSLGEDIYKIKPLFKLFVYINENIASLPLCKPSSPIVNAYYQHQHKELFYYLIMVRGFLGNRCNEKEYEAVIRPFYDWIENTYHMKSMNHKNNL
jgi:hypothetical protein